MEWFVIVDECVVVVDIVGSYVVGFDIVVVVVDFDFVVVDCFDGI